MSQSASAATLRAAIAMRVAAHHELLLAIDTVLAADTAGVGPTTLDLDILRRAYKAYGHARAAVDAALAPLQPAEGAAP